MSSHERATERAAGPEVVGFTVADPPGAWRAAGFAVGTGSDIARVGAVSVTCAGSGAGAGLVDWTLRAAPGGVATDLDGLPTRFVSGAVGDTVHHAARERQGTGSVHPNGALLVDHVVVLTPDLRRTTAAFEDHGLAVRRVRDTAAGRGARQVFFRSGEVIIEVVGPPETDPAKAGAPSKMFGLAITVADLDATAGLLGSALGTPKGAVQEGRRIATLRHHEVGMSTNIAFMSPRPGRPA